MKQLQIFDMFNRKRKPDSTMISSSEIDNSITKKIRTPEQKPTPNDGIDIEPNDTPDIVSFNSPETPIVVDKVEIISSMVHEDVDIINFTFPLANDKYNVHCARIADESTTPAFWLENFQGSVACKNSESDVAKAVIGVDCEWCPPWFRDNGPEKVCTIQIYCPIAGALVLSASGVTKLPQVIEEIFADERIIKVGVNIRGDCSRISRDFGCPVNSMLDVAKGRGRASLEDLCKKHCPASFHIAKDSVESQVRLGNWSAWPLTELQVKYASMDAVVSYLIYLYQNNGTWEKRLQYKMPKLSNMSLDSVVPKDPEEPELERNESTSSVNSQHSNFFMMQQNRSIVPPKRGVKEYPQGSATCLSKVVVVVSGVLDSMSRNEFSDYVVKHGGKVGKAITKATTHLVNDHGSIGPAKMKTCEAQGIPVVGEDAILELVKASLQ